MTELEKFANYISLASSFAGNVLMEETKAFVRENHKYHSANDFDKAHPKTLSQLEAEYLMNKAGYRKSSDLAKELMEKLDNKLNEMAMEYANAGHKDYFAVCEVIYHKVLRTVFKEYEKE